jgi:hypothetical protein
MTNDLAKLQSFGDAPVQVARPLLTHVRSNKARLSTTASANDQEFPGHPTDGQKPADAKGRSEVPIFCFRFGPLFSAAIFRRLTYKLPKQEHRSRMA